MNYAISLINAISNLPPVLIYLVIYVWLIAESMGVPVPNEAILLYAGYLIFAGKINAPIAWGAATLGSLTGSSAAWAIARRYGPVGVQKLGRYIFINEAKLAAAEAWFRRWGPQTVFIARLVPVVRTVISYPAGLSDVPYKGLAAATVVGAGIWAALMLEVGYQAGPHWTDLFNRYHNLAVLLGLVVILAVIAYFVLESRLKKRFVEGSKGAP
ncbi:MAG TPA: DedA family protein [Candidatus Dormibacteraeota bacterium]|nr:DedA family protein [Candidatus Dormibacteraeota bacterium]